MQFTLTKKKQTYSLSKVQKEVQKDIKIIYGHKKFRLVMK